jgi:hypothetical protein
MPGQVLGIPEVPTNVEPQLRRFLVEIRKAIKRLEPSVVAPAQVSNMTATAKAGGAIIQFTRSDGDSYVLYRNTVASLNGSVRIDIGMANSYTDEIGVAAQKIFYWIKAKKGGMEGVPVGPVTATTLALNATITLPTAPPGSQQPTRSDENGQVEPGRPTSTTYERV